jgi:hypothetical protein
MVFSSYLLPQIFIHLITSCIETWCMICFSGGVRVELVRNELLVLDVYIVLVVQLCC